ncbi:hypothetical protein ACQ859_19650 [Roseateles chitinivorans]|uniref:hypothetical protein n=1 Tax=Roseateles chitinivorans TaxID=2917965 RepID=UPI003D66B6D9
MIEQAAFAELFRGRPVPQELSRLLDFQNDLDAEYTESLFLTLRETNGLTAGWSKDPAFLARLTAFGVATGSGSFYALWNPEDGSAPAQWPVIVFGDEGGEWVIAGNVRELLQLAALDVEPMVMHDSAYFYIDDEDDEEDEDDEDDGEYIEAIVAYRDWLKATFDLEAVEDPDPVVEAAQARWQAAFDAWKRPFLQGDEGTDTDAASDDEDDDETEAGDEARSTEEAAPPAPTRPDTPERQLLLDFIADEASSLRYGEQGEFWPSHHHLITPLIGKAGKFLVEAEHTAFFFHLLRLDHLPSLKSEEDFALLLRAYEGLRSIVWRGYPVCSLPLHAAVFLFGHDQFARLPGEPEPSLAGYRSSLDFLRYARSFSHMPGIMGKRQKFADLSADRALVARVRKTLVHGNQELLDGLGQLWLWAFVFLVLQVEEEAQPVIRQIRDDAAKAGDPKHVETLERFIAASAG